HGVDLWSFQEVRIEAHHLLGNGPHRGVPTDAIYPRQPGPYPRFQRRRQAALTTTALTTTALTTPSSLKPRAAIARLALATVATNGTPLQQTIMDLLPTVPHLAGPQHMTRGISQQGQSGDRAAGGNLEAQGLRCCIGYRVLQEDRERVAAPHRRPPRSQ